MRAEDIDAAAVAAYLAVARWIGWVADVAEVGREKVVDVVATVTGKKADFRAKYIDAWNQTSRRIPWEFMLPQAALESDYGLSRIALELNNLSGRKGDGDAGHEDGGAVEQVNGQMVHKSAQWARFSSWVASIESQQDFLHHARYLEPFYNDNKGETSIGLRYALTLRYGWESLAAAGYATLDTALYRDRVANTAAGLDINPDGPLSVVG